jgi:hypothetical protein
MSTDRPRPDPGVRARELALRHGVPEEQVRPLLDQHDDESKLEEAIRNIAHFLRAPS